jgi:hypothetical protein
MLACWQQEHTYHLHVASFFNLIICVVEIIISNNLCFNYRVSNIYNFISKEVHIWCVSS